jgi:type I restriction enzyme R subunit
LKIIREDIETGYKEKLSQIYENLERLILKKDVKKSDIIEHDSYIKELLKYIITDLNRFRLVQGENSLGGMIICETSEQARKLYAYFDEVQNLLNMDTSEKSYFKAGLILHDSDDKETRKQIVKDFKKNMSIDILIVFNMLLTGFDAPRLKRLYFGRKLKDHNLLQALTRVNRPYLKNRYGFVIDFADIKENFETTNEAYLHELNRFNDPEETGEGNETDTFRQIIEDKDSLITQMIEVRQVLFNYTIENVEEFSSEISTIEDKQELLILKKVLISARDCCNIVRTFGDEELKTEFSRLEITKLPQMISEVQHAIDTINQKEVFEGAEATRHLINEAMQDIEFSFRKIGEEEMKLISGGIELQDKWRRAIQSFTENIDPEDPDYITLREAFIQRFKEHGFEVDSVSEFEKHSKALDEVLKKLTVLMKRNAILLKRYNGDVKFARIHKRICEENIKRSKNNEKPILSLYDEVVMNILLSIKINIDQKVFDRNDILKKDAYFEQTVMTQIKEGMKKLSLECEREDRIFIQSRIARQYLNQYNVTYPAA